MATKKTEAAAKEPEKIERLSFSYNGTTYTMEFNRRTAKIAEQDFGVSIQDIQDMKVTNIDDLFYCSFAMHHPKMKRSTSDMLYEKMEDKQGLMVALFELYANAINSLFEEPDEGNAISWKIA